MAELVAGRGRSIRSFLYVFVDTFIGGGLVLDSHLRGGVHGNAGAVGSLPLGLRRRAAQRRPRSCSASPRCWNLEALYAKAGARRRTPGPTRARWPTPWLPSTRAWLGEACPAIALAINSAACLLDLDGVIIDGSFSRELLRRAAARGRATRSTATAGKAWRGRRCWPAPSARDARAIGGALLPLYANFAPDRDLFLKIDKMNGAAR